MKKATKCLVLVLSLFTSTAFANRFVFIPEGAASASGFFNFNQAFDSQPLLTDLTDNNLISRSTDLGSNVPSFTGRAGYIDFGTNFSSVQIVELWTAYRRFSPWADLDGQGTFGDLYWSDTPDTSKSGNWTDITDSNFNFAQRDLTGLASQIGGVNSGSNILWSLDAEFSSPIVPQNRYLILETQSGTGAVGFARDRATELAIVAIPEPSTILLSLLALGSVALFRRRK